MNALVRLRPDFLSRVVSTAIIILAARFVYGVFKMALQKRSDARSAVPVIVLRDEFTLKATTVLNFITPEEFALALTNDKTRASWDLSMASV